MRGKRDPQGTMLALVNLEERVPKDHPLRTIKKVADKSLERLSGQFDGMYSGLGRASVPPERLLKASLLISLYSVRSERAFCEELQYNLLFRWFLYMNLTESSFAPTVFTKNRRRLLEHRTAQALFDEVVHEAARRGLLSDEHFSVDGTLIEAMASIKSFRKRDDEGNPPDDDPGNPWGVMVDFRGEKLKNETHESRTDPGALLMRKGKGREARMSFMGHAPMENRNGLLMDFVVSSATGTAERDAVPVMLDDARQRGFHPRSLGADKGYDTWDCVRDMRNRGVTPHVAQRKHSAIDGRTTRHRGYGKSQKIRKQVEEIFGWMKTVGGLRRSRYRGVERTGLAGYLVATAYNLVKMANLLSREYRSRRSLTCLGRGAPQWVDGSSLGPADYPQAACSGPNCNATPPENFVPDRSNAPVEPAKLFFSSLLVQFDFRSKRNTIWLLRYDRCGNEFPFIVD